MKSVDVIPMALVSAAPSNPPSTLAPLFTLINVANRVASMPGGHTCAASTSMGMKDICQAVTEQG